jgi:integrase
MTAPSYQLALQAGKLLHAPHIPMLHEENVRQGFFERDTFNDVCDALPAPIRPVVTFAYLTGWRVPSEVLSLQWAQVDRRVKMIRLEPGQAKNDEGRTFPYELLPELADVIEAQWTAHEQLQAASVICPFVFHRQGAPIKTFRTAWATACAAVGLPGKIPHDFRRTAVRNLVRAGVPEQMAMKLTGHKTRSVFDRYDIVNESDLRNAVGKLAGTEQGQSSRAGRVAKFADQRES